ncbi:MAG: tripartite tricarboxylate transporter substrate binding protein [Betaproteobacteria bacterium]
MKWYASINLAGGLMLAALCAAQAADFPQRPVRIVVPIGPGSSMDIIARVLAQKLNEAWGQPVIVDNRAGAGGNIGAETVAKAAPDGYTVMFASSSFAISPSVYRKMPYEVLRDFEPVTQISSRGNVLVVAAGSPLNTVRELVAFAKARPEQLSFGSGGGTGSSDHMAGELFNMLAGVQIVHVPYKSGPQAQNDLIGGQLSIYLGGIPIQLPMIKTARVKPLGTSGLKRSPMLPEIPTLHESGVTGYEVDVWYGLFAPRGTPAAVVTRIAADVTRIVRTPAMAERWQTLGVEPAGTTPPEFRAKFTAEIDKWRRVVKAARIEIE